MNEENYTILLEKFKKEWTEANGYIPISIVANLLKKRKQNIDFLLNKYNIKKHKFEDSNLTFISFKDYDYLRLLLKEEKKN